jgi:hypothetical protein
VLRREAQSMASPSKALTTFGAAPGIFEAFLWQNVSIVVWSGTATLESVDVYEDLCRQSRERFPAGLSSVHIIVPRQSLLPGSQVRDALTRVNAQYLDLVGAVAIVIQGGGFWASAVRGMITALTLSLTRSRGFELRIHAHVDEVAEWLPAAHLKRTGVTLGHDELQSALQRAVRV